MDASSSTPAMDASSSLPAGGEQLLAFKRASEARSDQNPFGANANILDAPDERLAELEGFDELREIQRARAGGRCARDRSVK